MELQPLPTYPSKRTEETEKKDKKNEETASLCRNSVLLHISFHHLVSMERPTPEFATSEVRWVRIRESQRWLGLHPDRSFL
jgi:hypothetical protein